MNSKKIILLVLLSGILTAGTAQVQKVQNDPAYDYKWLHFGFTVGLNTMDFAFRRPADAELFADLSRITPGFQVMIVSELRMDDYWSFRFLPGITFGQREVTFFHMNEDSLGNTAYSYDRRMTVESNYIDFPMIFKYKSKRINNYRPFLIAGLTPRYDMAARKDYEEDSEIFIRLKRIDLACEFGIGLDNYLQYFKFTTELKISVGLRDMLVHEPDAFAPQYANSIDRLNSYVLMLCFHFE